MDHFIISCTNLHLKYLHWLFVSCRVLALPLSTSEKIKNSNFLSDLKRQAQFFLSGEVKSFHLYPEPFLLPPESKVSTYLPLWLRHFIIIGTLWAKADTRDKIFSIPRLSDKCWCVRCAGLLSVFTCVSLYPHSCPFSWYRSYLLTWHPLPLSSLQIQLSWSRRPGW